MMRVPTAEDLALLPNRGELSYELPNVTWPDGSPVQLTLRALGALEQAAVDRAAIAAAAAYKGEYDDTTALVETVFYAIASPKLEDEHKKILWRWNVWILEQIADQVAVLGRLPARELETHLARLAGMAIPQPTASPDRAARKRRAAESARAARDAAGDAAEPGGGATGA